MGSRTASGSPDAIAERGEHVAGGDRARDAPRDSVADELEHTCEASPGAAAAGQIVGCEVERLREGLASTLQVVLVAPQPRATATSRPRRLRAQARPPRTAARLVGVLEDELVRSGVDLADHDGVARLDVGEERVEHAARALHVLAGPERLFDGREDPDDRPL